MGEKEMFTLSEGDRVRRDGAQIGERRSGTADELMLNVQNCFCDHGKIAFKEQVINADDGASERIFDGREESVGAAIGNCSESRIERSTGNRGDGVAKKLNGRSFAESATFA